MCIARVRFLCYHVKKSEQRLIFNYKVGNSSMFAVLGQLYRRIHDNIANKHGTYKHSFFIPRHITWYIRTFILHAKPYCIARAKHQYCTPVYKTRASFDVCHLCVRFHIVRYFDEFEARSARAMSTASCLCNSHTRNLSIRAFALQDAHLGSTLGHLQGWRRLYHNHSEDCKCVDPLVIREGSAGFIEQVKHDDEGYRQKASMPKLLVWKESSKLDC